MIKYIMLFAVFCAAMQFPKQIGRFGALLRLVGFRLTGKSWVPVVLVAAFPMLIRALLLPLWPIPAPVIQDEFSYLYAADTFASGRLWNPSHRLWQFFEAQHVVVQPAMFSKYPPAQSMLLALGQIAGEPWLGVWLSSGILCSACYWLFAALMPPRWALLGALIPASSLALSSYWMNSYWGGNVAAAAGALMLGSFLRLWQHPQRRWAAVFAAGWGVLAASRPYEGACLLALPLICGLVWKGLPRATWLALVSTGALFVVMLAGYNTSITGSPWKLPYSVYSEQYAYVPAFAFLPLAPQPHYLQEIMKTTMSYDEIRYQRMRSSSAFSLLLDDWLKALDACMPQILLVAAILSLVLARERLLLWLTGLLGLGMLGVSVETYHFAHYFAPFVPLLFLLTVVGLRALGIGNRWRRAAQATLLAGAVGQSLLAGYRAIHPWERPSIVVLRPVVQDRLGENLEEHLIFVRDTASQGRYRASWTYNRADLNRAAVIWAADLGDEQNQKLVQMYPGRRLWMLAIEPPLILQPYGSASMFQKPIPIP